MNDRTDLKLVQTDDPRMPAWLARPKPRSIAAGVALAILVAALMQWAGRHEGASHAATEPESAHQAEPANFDYFPSRYVNQATEVEEHIQAF